MGQLREDLRDTAIAAMALADVRTVKQQPLATNCRYCFDHALERFAAIPVAGDSRCRRSESDGLQHQ